MNDGDASVVPDERGTSLAAGRGLSIAEVSRQLGVPMPTLRSWELRYGMPTSGRAPGKHRRYSSSDVHALRLMRDEIARGKPARLAADSVRRLVGPAGAASAYVEAVLDASRRGDALAVRARLDDARGALGLGPCLDDVLLPAMQQVGLWWETGLCTAETEHVTTRAAHGWLDALVASAPAPAPSPPVVLACGPSDLHTLGLEALGVLLQHAGWSCRLLGAQTSVPALVDTVRSVGAQAVVVVSHLNSGRARAVRSIRAVSHEQATVFYAGNAFTAARSRRNLPGTFLGSRLQTACELIAAELVSGDDARTR